MTTACAALYTPRDTRNIQIFNAWLAAGMVCFVAATLLFDGKYLLPGIAAWSLVAATVILMGIAVRSYVVFLREADELLRKVHVEALGAAFGAGVVFMLCWRLCERLGAPKLDVNDSVMVMMLVWAAGQWVGMRRYGGGEE